MLLQAEHHPGTAHVGLRLAEPHGEQLRALDGDEVGLALAGNGLRQKGLAATRWPVEQHTLQATITDLGTVSRNEQAVQRALK